MTPLLLIEMPVSFDITIPLTLIDLLVDEI
jgi:hypothetical protein